MNRELPPLITISTELGDETVAQLLDLLYDIAAAIETQYAGQLHRYYQRPDQNNPQRQPPVLRDPPF